MRFSRLAAVFAIATTFGCGGNLSGLQDESEFPYRVNLIFEIDFDVDAACLQRTDACEVRLKGNVTNRHNVRVTGAQVWAKVAPATTFTPLVQANQSGIFNVSVVMEKTASGRAVTLCSGATLAVALTGNCPTLTLP